MALLENDDLQYLRESFAELARDVTVTVVTRERSRLILTGFAEQAQGGEEDAGAEVRQVLSEVASASPRIRLETVDAGEDEARAARIAGDKLPAIAFSAEGARGTLRYFGTPAGYEMSTVVAAIVDLGGPEEIAPPEVTQRMGALKKDVHVQVFVTPS